ncbi:MAG TPA: glycoside hydrolase family 3 N-terminal domain-containing protein [Polyangia bacterium]|jgi:beta-glucosidase|nr:glycoside hydrolase family 3 N-terminal domain-containing protein [Polyangia bacterium]
MKRPFRMMLLVTATATTVATWLLTEDSRLGAAETPAKPPASASYRDAKAAIDARVADLVGRMTPTEKVAQLMSVNWQHTHLDDNRTHALSPQAAQKLIGNGIGEITRPSDRHDDARSATEFANAVQKFLVTQTRLGIPALMHEEALHGFQAPAGTSFPQAIALAASFDPDMVEQVFTVAARQARARGVQHVLAPVVDVARDPRWGRIEETYGEDPYLVARMGVAAIRGFQGRRKADAPIDAAHVAATVKHFTGHGTPEGGRNTGPGNYSMHVLREVFLPPVEAAVREAAVASVMPSYNEVDGIPSHANRWLLGDLLRGEWGFAGFIVSDYFGVAALERQHHVVPDLRTAGRHAIEAGVDLEVPEGEAYPTLVEEMQAGRVAPGLVDQAVGRVLRAKFQLGLFEQPYTLAPVPEPELPADRALARHAAEEAVILLKNEGGLLPFNAAKLKSIAVVGPNADTVRLGGYSGKPERVISVFEGIKTRAAGRIVVTTAPGCGLTRGERGWSDDLVEMADPAEDARLIAEAAKVSAQADLTVLVVGQNEQLSREGWADNHRGDRMDLDLVGRQNDLARAVLANKKPVVLVLLHGGPLAIPDLARAVPAILDGFYLGEETGTAVAEVLFGDVSPAGRLPVSVPRSVGTVPTYYNYKPSGRRLYLGEEPGPLWPFGFGLSYTTFRYENPAVTPARIATNGKTTASVSVTNTGKRASDEVVQLYIHDLVSSVTRPISELKGFRRIHLKPGESKKVEFPIGFDELSFFDAGMKRVVEPGRFEVMFGGSSADLKKVGLEVTTR